MSDARNWLAGGEENEFAPKFGQLYCVTLVSLLWILETCLKTAVWFTQKQELSEDSRALMQVKI